MGPGMFDGLARAMVAFVVICIAATIAITLLGVWLWNHISFAWHWSWT